MSEQEELDRWLSENKSAINEKIQLGLEQLDRGDVIPEDELDAYLKKLKEKS
jgi:hypothetical protein